MLMLTPDTAKEWLGFRITMLADAFQPGLRKADAANRQRDVLRWIRAARSRRSGRRSRGRLCRDSASAGRECDIPTEACLPCCRTRHEIESACPDRAGPGFGQIGRAHV